MENKKKLALLAGVVLLLAAGFGGWKYWKSHQAVQMERLALDGEPGKQLASDIMDKMYGKDAYDGKEKCWNIDHKIDGDAFTYCMRPVTLDRVQADGEERLYLFAGGSHPDGTHADTEGLAGAFITQAKTGQLIAGDRELPFVSGSGSAPDADAVKLLALSKTGYMAWMAEGYDEQMGVSSSFPQMFAPKGKKIVDIAGDVFGKEEGMAEQLKFEYLSDAAQADAKVFPLLLKVSDDKHKQVASFRFRFDSQKWKYVCADVACSKKEGIPEAQPMSQQDDEGGSTDQPPANANAALFSDGTELSAADLKDVLAAVNAAFVVKDQQTWGFVTPECAKPFPLSAEVVKGYEDNRNMLWLQGGNSCTSGNTEHSIWLFIRGEDGHLRANLGLPAKQATVTDDATDGYHDIRLSGNGFCEAVWRWNGSQYAHLKNIATQPGGCGGE
ncbi:hypothetical protein [Chromobacterium vaccinii]|uniref:hypothetical protein n=1 Tax=Chromobacterium vaccinii TaxID=1108595 RepID=UPI00061808AB|nr:hypothetical protein [Chromobacterium vaccinii]